MTDDATPTSPVANGPARPKGALAGLFSAQESGLLIVIILMMTALTIFGGSKPRKELLELPTDAQVTLFDAAGNQRELGTFPLNQLAEIVVTDNASETRYATSQGWSYSRDRAGTQTLARETTVNKFLDLENLVLIAKDASFIAIMAVAMTAVIILAGIDLSVGSIYGIAAIVGAIALHELGPQASGLTAVFLALAVCLGVGALCGFCNGTMIVGLKVHPFVITLGMMAALRGLAIIIPQKVYGEQSIAGFPAAFTRGFFKAEIFGVYPVPVIVMLVVGLAGWFILSRTVIGRQVFAIGGNETAAKYAGIPVGRVKIIVYTVMGTLAGLSACVYLGYLGAAETSAGNTYELRVIAAAVIGGASLMGGRGSALGAVLGAIIIELINNGMIILEIDQSWNQVVMGAAIIIAVVIDQAKRRFSSGGRRS